MLNVFYGREDIDKQRYLFARARAESLARGQDGSVLLIVPDQFTLETERAAFDYLEAPAFVDPVVTSMNRLAGRVLAETGGRTDYIDQYGKYMLIARLLHRGREALSVYRGLENSTAFIEKVSAAIMSFKTHLVTPDALASAVEAMEGDSLLRRKLVDLLWIYRGYEEALAAMDGGAGRPDSTDVTRLFAARIRASAFLRGAVVWVYGYDYISPLYTEAIAGMACVCAEVNVVLTAEPGDAFFALTNRTCEALCEAARAAGSEAAVHGIAEDGARRGVPCAYREKDARPEQIAHIERALFAYGGAGAPVFAGAAGEAGGVPPALRLVAARDFESEALAAAAVIRRLVFEEGFRYRDILVLCNDPGRRASAIKRVFDACGLPVFFDRRRDVDHNPVLEYILVLPEILARGRRSEDVFRWIRTGLVPIAPADAEELENYALRYRLRGTAWGKPLRRGAKEYEEEVFARIGAAARQVAEMLDAFATRFSAGRTARERTEGLRAYLVEDARLPVMIEQLAAALEADGYDEYAAEMRGIRDIAEGILDQIAGSLGDLVMGMEEYAVVLRAGFASVKMGVLPPTSDRVVVGTMQRTRTGSARAMLVLGANDGLLPMFESSDDLIGDEEKEALEELGFSAFRSAGNLMHEERLAIYKNLSKPTRLLYLSYTDAGMGGETAGSSQVFTRLHRLFPDVPVEVADEVPVYGVLAEAPDAGGAQRIAPELLRALLAAQGGAGDDGAGGGDDGAGGGGALTLSTSAIERYSRCPLSWFLGSGLKLSERRIFAVDSRNIGEAYHEVLMEFGKAMSADGLPVSDPASRWRLSARADTDRMIDGIYEALSERLFEGVFRERPQDRYRGTRLVRVLKEVAWALTERVRESGTETLLFEQAFDGLTLGGGVQARGRIDRIDVLADGRAKVLDYKSGGDRFSFDEIESGWQLQLMLYLKAVADTYSYEPAGVSYFPVKEAHVNLSGDKAPRTPEEIEESIRGAYRSDGFAVGSPEDAAPGERVVSAGEFASLRETVDALLGALAADIAAGDTSARPKTSGHKSARGEEINACTYCRFRSVCGRDMS